MMEYHSYVGNGKMQWSEALGYRAYRKGMEQIIMNKS